MTDTEINTAIAEACGWRRVAGPEGLGVVWRDPQGYYRPTYYWRDYISGTVPPFCSNLDAMHEAEEHLDGMNADTRSLYYDYILLQCAELFEKSDNGFKRDPFNRDWAVLRSTARQRAEAFLRTIGKWKDL